MKKQNKPKISAFFPVYNEEGNLEKLAKDAINVLGEVSENYEMIFVLYDGSTDNSREIIKKLSRKDKHIRLVIQPLGKKGVGYAYNLGYISAKYPIIFYADSDNQFDLNEIKKFIPYLENYDVIAGYRINRQDPLTRILTSKIYNLLIRVVFGKLPRDVDCAFRMVKRDIFNKISLKYNTGFATAEILVRAKKEGFKIKDIGIKHLPRYSGTSTFEGGLSFPKPKVIINQVKDLFYLRKELKR